ncbi:SNF2-related domain-containing protein [Desulfonema limicola]|uniref:SNF2-related domain-containing protein n=1 Tax=Desulfonema limicola TaxID=45656 RepID=A0A975B4N3_9BACT|nr:DEAD/DEAH box helicase [Desulfonema limicola]QTA78711.1 SNF2-related domain-containing protein [Desulfonema limicola]
MSRLNEFLNEFGPALRSKVANAFSPVFDSLKQGEQEIQWQNQLKRLLRQPYPGQSEAILALCKGFKLGLKGLFLVAEMGSGKSMMGICASWLVCKNRSRTLVMCPGHLVDKWAREIMETVPNAIIVNMNKPGLEDVFSLKENPKPKGREFWIIGKERAKNHYTRRPATVIRMDLVSCPTCGVHLTKKPNVKHRKPVCPNKECRAPLWQSNNERLRRYAKSEYVKRYLKKNVFDFFIGDECHQYKAGDSAQGQAYANFVNRSRFTLNLTGTLMGGYSTNLFYLLYRLVPKRMKEICEYKSSMSFAEKFGVIERIEKEAIHAGAASIGRSGTTTRVVERPGISPLIFTDLLLQRCVFLRLDDVAQNLPPYTEHVIEVEMSPDQKDAYSEFENELITEVRQALARGDKSLLGAMVNSLLAYPDGARRGELVEHPYKVNPLSGQPLVVASAPQIDEQMLPKEQRLIELVKMEKSKTRKVMICLEHTGTRDLIPDIKTRLENAGISVLVLRQTTVKSEKREAWLRSKMKTRNYDVFITNPRLIETGLDLLEFPSIIFFQTGYSTFTLRQSSRRSWRIGQDKDVRVYFMTYLKTMQSTALSLIADKLQVALAVEGNLSDAGLTALAEGDASMMIKMAKTLVGQEKTPEIPLGELFGNIGEKNLQADTRLDAADSTITKTEITTIKITTDDGREKTIVVEKVVRGRVQLQPESNQAVAFIDNTDIRFMLAQGRVTYKGKQIGHYKKNGMGQINGKLIQIEPDPEQTGYLLLELRKPENEQIAA